MQKSTDETLTICSILSLFFKCLPQLVASPICKTGWTDSYFGQLIKLVLDYLWISKKSESWESHGNTAVLLAIKSWKAGINSRSKVLQLNSVTNTSKLSDYQYQRPFHILQNYNWYFEIQFKQTQIHFKSQNKDTNYCLSNQTKPPLGNISHLNWSFKPGYCRSRDLQPRYLSFEPTHTSFLTSVKLALSTQPRKHSWTQAKTQTRHPLSLQLTPSAMKFFRSGRSSSSSHTSPIRPEHMNTSEIHWQIITQQLHLLQHKVLQALSRMARTTDQWEGRNSVETGDTRYAKYSNVCFHIECSSPGITMVEIHTTVAYSAIIYI